MVAREETPSLRIYRLVLSGSAMRAARIVSQLAILATAARLLSTAEVGVYAYVMVAVSVLTIPAQLGLPPIVIRETARALAEDRTDDARAIIVWANRVVLLAGTVAIALLAMFLMLGPGPQIGDEATACAAFLLLAGTCLHVNGAVLRGMGRILPGQVGIFIVAPLVTLSLLVGLWATGIDLDVGDVLLCHCAGMAAALVTVSGALAFGMGGPRTKAAPVELRSRLRSMALVALVGSVYILNTSLDTIMLGILTDEEGVALYRVAAVAAGCIAVIAQAFNAMIGPVIARGGSRPNIEMIERVLRTSAPLVQGVALAVVAALALGGMTLLPLVFGAPYAAAYAAMAILLVAQYANIVFGPVGVLLNMTGNEHVALRTAIIAVIMNLCLNLLLIPPLGAEGAALATATTVACWNFGLWRSARAATGVDTLCWLKFASKT